MRQSHSQINTLLILVALLAVVGGLTIVAVTSPQSFSLDNLAGLFGGASATPRATPTVAPTASPTVALPTETPAVTATRRPTLVPPPATATSSLPSATPVSDSSPTPTEIVLPDNAVALAEVTVQDAENGRVRDQPGGDTVIAVVPNGTQIYVLDGQVQIDNVIWMEVELPDGETGWMADFLLKIIYSRP